MDIKSFIQREKEKINSDIRIKFEKGRLQDAKITQNSISILLAFGFFGIAFSGACILFGLLTLIYEIDFEIGMLCLFGGLSSTATHLIAFRYMTARIDMINNDIREIKYNIHKERLQKWE